MMEWILYALRIYLKSGMYLSLFFVIVQTIRMKMFLDTKFVKKKNKKTITNITSIYATMIVIGFIPVIRIAYAINAIILLVAPKKYYESFDKGE